MFLINILSVLLILLRLAKPSSIDEDPEVYILEGHWERFEGMPSWVDRSKLEYFELSKVKLDTGILLRELEKCPNLRTIKLTNLKWNGRFESKIELPHLATYIVELPVSRTCALHAISEFLDLLFFVPPNINSSKDNPWMLESRFELIDISCTNLDLAGFMDEKPRPPDTLLKIASGQELIANKVHFDILQHLDFEDFIKISFTKSYLNVSLLEKFKVSLLELIIEDSVNLDSIKQLNGVLALAEFVKYLQLRVDVPNVKVVLTNFDSRSLKTLKVFNKQSLEVSGNMTFYKLRHLELGSSKFPTILNTLLTAPRLKTLNLYNAEFSPLADAFTCLQSLKTLESFTSGQMLVDISSLPSSHLNRMEFEPSTKVIQTQNSEFLKVRSIKIDSSCDLDESMVSQFSKTFPQIKSFIFSGVNKAKLSPQLFFQVLNTSAVHFTGRYHRTHNQPNNFTDDQKVVSELLAQFGVPEDYPVNSITLKRESKYGDWIWYYAKSTTFENFQLTFYPVSISLMCVFGLIGNILNGIILFRKPIQSSTTCILLCLTFCDFILICASINLIPYALSNGFRFRHKLPPQVFPADLFLRHLEVFIFYPIRKTAYTGSVYTTVLITYERFIAVAFPLHAKRLISIRKSAMYCCIILLAAAVVNLPRWVEFYSLDDIDKETGHMSSLTLLSSRAYRKYYHGWAWTIIIYILPVLLIATLNTTIYLKVIFATKQRLRFTAASGNAQPPSSVDMSLTRMLICLVLVFVILNLVSAGIVLYHTLFEFHIVSFYWDKEKDMSEIEVVACLPVLINSSVNFIIYCAMGRKFREEFLKLIPKSLRCLRQKTKVQCTPVIINLKGNA